MVSVIFCPLRSLPQSDPDERDSSVRLGHHQKPAQVHDPSGSGRQLSAGRARGRVGVLFAQKKTVRADVRLRPGSALRDPLRTGRGRIRGAQRTPSTHGRLQRTLQQVKLPLTFFYP